jgi:hypothetical protein
MTARTYIQGGAIVTWHWRQHFWRRVSSDFTTPCTMFSYPNHSAQYGIPQSLQTLVIRFGGLIKMTDGRPLIYVFGPQLDVGFLHFVFQDCHEPYSEHNHTCLSVNIFKYSRNDFGCFLTAWSSGSPNSFLSLKHVWWTDTWLLLIKQCHFKIIIFCWQQTSLNSRKRRDGSWFWGHSPLRSAKLCVFVYHIGRSQALCSLLATPRAALCDVSGDSQCLRGASVQRSPLKATHFSPAIRDPQAVKRCTYIMSLDIRSDSCVWGEVVWRFGRGQHCLLMDWWLGYITFLPSLGISCKYAGLDVISLHSEHQYSTEIVTSTCKSGSSRHNFFFFFFI